MYSPGTNVRAIGAVVGLGIIDVPTITSPNVEGVLSVTLFVVNVVVIGFVLAIAVLAARLYFLRTARAAVPEAEPVWLKTFDLPGEPGHALE
jgi:hypothetical protein